MGSIEQPTTWLDRLSGQLNIDIDCMDPAEARKLLPFKPHDQTSNQRLVYEQMISPANSELLLKTAREFKNEGWKTILIKMGALLCAKNIENIQGRVLLQSSPFYAYDTEKIVEEARTYAQEFEKLGISKDRFCIKIPSTGPALNAGRILLQEGIRTLGTSLFSRVQAIAASQAGCLSISPYLNFPAFHKDPGLWPNVLDPALEHPMSARIYHILDAYQTLHKETGQVQPLLKPASFKSPREAMAMGELGCQHATIPEHILNQLVLLDLEGNPPPGDAAKAKGIPSQRLAQLAKVDPLAGPNWDGKLARTDVDYLADNGSALAKAIDEDSATKTGLQDSLDGFKAQELKSKAAIEEILRQV